MHTLPSREKMPLTESIFIAAQKLIFTSRVVTGPRQTRVKVNRNDRFRYVNEAVGR
nr:hypothetical protein P5646_10715 [Bacillus velezensis]